MYVGSLLASLDVLTRSVRGFFSNLLDAQLLKLEAFIPSQFSDSIQNA